MVKKDHQPCPDCGSRDARTIFAEGNSYCHSCGKRRKIANEEDMPSPNPYRPKISLEEIKEFRSREFTERKISKEVCHFFEVKVSYDEEGSISTHYYPYNDGTAYKVRKLPKEFTTIGKITKLFGQEKFNGGGRKIIICEGEIDALSVAESMKMRYNKIYPVVALPSSTQTKILIEERAWLRSFQEIILCFDEDEAGEKAKQEAIRILGMDKVKLTKLPYKDANEVLLKKGGLVLQQLLFDAASYIPPGFLSMDEVWSEIINNRNVESIPYPPCLDGINEKLKGMRLGEISLFIAGTGSGKTTVFKEIMLHLLETTEESIGIFSLEEIIRETYVKLAAMSLKKNFAEGDITDDELKDVLFNKFNNRVFIPNMTEYSADQLPLVIPDFVEYMCLKGCKYFFLDHITIATSEGFNGSTGNEATDKMMNILNNLTKKYNIWLGLISHLRKTSSGKPFEEGTLPRIDDIKGSGSIKQISYDIVGFARDMTAADERQRNLITIRVLKCRHTGLTGPVMGAFYDYKTGRLEYAEDAVDDEFLPE